MWRVIVGVMSLAVCSAPLADGLPIALESRIPLAVKGRIDHLAVDVPQKRLFVAALGNNTVEVVDLAAGKVARSLAGFAEPQGVAYSASAQTLYVANGGDGSLRIFQGAGLEPAGRLELGEDADNVRIDPQQQRVYVGYGSGALAVVDASTHRKIASIPLKAHPESFQLEQAGSRIFVNVPDASEIAVIDRRTNRQIASWPTKDLRAGFPLALDEPNKRVLAVFRRPATLASFDMDSGAEISRVATCGDADDVFVDSNHGYIYVSCGEGFIDVWGNRPDGMEHVGRVKTGAGARTALFSAELDRLFLAVRAGSGEQAAIWVFRASR